jgi:hypothetical protein
MKDRSWQSADGSGTGPDRLASKPADARRDDQGYPRRRSRSRHSSQRLAGFRRRSARRGRSA